MIAALPFARWFAVLCFCALLKLSAQPQLPIAPPLPPSPVQQFREWLAMKPEERVKAVSDYPADKQKVLLEKLRAYTILPPEERERRLQMVELRWFMLPLMAMKSDERQSATNLVPAALRRIVQERLARWDSLPEDQRKEILENDKARDLVMRYFGQLQQGHTREDIWKILTPERRIELEKALAVWDSQTSASRGRSAAQFAAFFQLSQAQQARAFEELPDNERQDIQKTLDAFAKLSPEQRRVCVESFQKFALLPPPERASFLRNAARWEAMSPQDRATWKELVTKLPPLPAAPVPQPPKPEASSGRRSMALTNAADPQ